VLLDLLFRPYNARLTREAVAPIRLTWKGQANGGSGATFAVRPTFKTQRAKGVTATLSRVESIVIRRTTYAGLYFDFFDFGAVNNFQDEIVSEERGSEPKCY
jgi:hypothetical protein